MSMPLIPPFAVTASYQNSQYATGTYTQGGSQVFSHLVTPPTSGVTAETSADSGAHARGFSAYGAANEVQVITVNGNPNGGTFLLEWGDAVTGTIAYNASAATVQAALDGLVTVPAATGGTNDVQTVTITGAPAGGTFTLTFGGQTTSALAYNAAASAVQTAFLALSSVGAGNATVTGSAGGPYTVTFIGSKAKAAQGDITASGASLTGGTSPGVSIAHTTPGVAPTQNITVTGSSGGPWTVTFSNRLTNLNVGPIAANSAGLTGGTNPSVTVVTTTAGRTAFVNQPIANAKQQYDPMVNFYDRASGNHF